MNNYILIFILLIILNIALLININKLYTKENLCLCTGAQTAKDQYCVSAAEQRLRYYGKGYGDLTPFRKEFPGV